jgi:hypothetical protein
LRFKVGQRVSCNVNNAWAEGTVTQLNYRDAKVR